MDIEKLKQENDLLCKLAAALTSRISSMTACPTHEELEDLKLENEKGRASLEAKPSMVVSTSLMEKELEVSRLENEKLVLQKLVLELENEKLRAKIEAKSVAAPTATPREFRTTIEAKSVAAPTATPGELRASKEAKTLVASANVQELEKLKREIDKLKSTREAKLQNDLDRVKRENYRLKDHKTLSETERRRLSRLDHQAAVNTQKRTEEIKKLVREGQTVDLAFLVDATGSMQVYSLTVLKEKFNQHK